MGPLALDASVVIALLDGADAHHERAVAELSSRQGGPPDLLIAATAYTEALIRPLRDGHGDTVERFLARGPVEVVPIDRTVAAAAARLRADHASLRLGDALVLATAHAREAELLTFDERLHRIARRGHG
ncbi:MAG: type II toxin-antitoxin system VapC family toxin [Thermoleophilaceae bacterium]